MGEVKHPVCYYLCNITAIDSNIEVPCDVDRNLKRRDMLEETAKFVVELLLNSAGNRSVQRHNVGHGLTDFDQVWNDDAIRPS